MADEDDPHSLLNSSFGPPSHVTLPRHHEPVDAHLLTASFSTSMADSGSFLEKLDADDPMADVDASFDPSLARPSQHPETDAHVPGQSDVSAEPAKPEAAPTKSEFLAPAEAGAAKPLGGTLSHPVPTPLLSLRAGR